MRTILCRLLGHRDVPARRLAPMVIPTMGLVGGWEQTDPAGSRGVGCTRCRRYLEHVWVGIARDVTGREP
jgi:hypothetical protein